MDQLHIKLPDQEEGTPYAVNDIVSHMNFVLGGSAFGSSELLSASKSDATGKVLKQEDLSYVALTEKLQCLETELTSVRSQCSAP